MSLWSVWDFTVFNKMTCRALLPKTTGLVTDGYKMPEKKVQSLVRLIQTATVQK